jgi:MarR family transcriptional regulator, organic hydroperoxide resistance regulator
MAVDEDIVRRFTWAIASISVHLEELNGFWGRALDVSGPQWMILITLAELDQDNGAPVNAIAKKLHVDPFFVTTQSKILEKKGLVRRWTSEQDARVVQMSLTDKTCEQMAQFASQQEALNEFVFGELGGNGFRDITQKLGELSQRLEKACLKATAGLVR